MKVKLVLCAVAVGLGLPVSAETLANGHVLKFAADVAQDSIAGVRAWAGTAEPFASLAAPVLKGGLTGQFGQRVVVQTAASVGDKSFDLSDAKAVANCSKTLPLGGYHCEVIARVSAQ